MIKSSLFRFVFLVGACVFFGLLQAQTEGKFTLWKRGFRTKANNTFIDSPMVYVNALNDGAQQLLKRSDILLIEISEINPKIVGQIVKYYEGTDNVADSRPSVVRYQHLKVSVTLPTIPELPIFESRHTCTIDLSDQDIHLYTWYKNDKDSTQGIKLVPEKVWMERSCNFNDGVIYTHFKIEHLINKVWDKPRQGEVSFTHQACLKMNISVEDHNGVTVAYTTETAPIFLNNLQVVVMDIRD